MAAKEHITEQIRYHTELVRLLSVLLLAVGGGTASLFFRSRDYWTGTFTVVGLIVMSVVCMGIGYLDRRVRKLIGKLLEA